MDRIIKAVIFDGKARVALLDTTEAVNKAIQMHGLSPLAAAALGRSLTFGAYISANLKGANDKFSMVIDGAGPLGKIVVAGESGNSIRGFVENPTLELPSVNGKHNVGGAVGRNGEITIIKDLGLKEPYVGKCKLISGELAEDFSTYLLKSEGILNSVALGVLTDKNGCKASGGIVVEAMPSADDGMIFMLEDIMSQFTKVSSMLAEKPIEEIMQFHFGHLDSQIFEAEEIKLECHCRDKVIGVVKSLGRAEAEDIIKERGSIDVRCDFCSKTYSFDEKALDDIFNV